MRKKINLYDNRFNNKREKKTNERKLEREGKLAALEFKAAPFCFCFFFVVVCFVNINI